MKITKRQLRKLIQESTGDNRIRKVARLSRILLEQDDELQSSVEDNAQAQAEEEKKKAETAVRWVQEVGSVFSRIGDQLITQVEATVTDDAVEAMGMKEMPPRQVAETLVSQWAAAVAQNGIDDAESELTKKIEELIKKAFGDQAGGMSLG